MTRLAFGLLAGLGFGVVDIVPMFRMSFPDKRAAISAAFIERFAIGLVVALVNLPWPAWLTGLVFGSLLSLPSAIITKARVPIMVTGALGGAVIGVILPHVIR